MTLVWSPDYLGSPGKVVLSNPLTCTNTPKGDNKLYSDAKGVVPSLDLRFAESKTLNDYMTGQNLITFSRPVGANQSPGTYVDENGIIQLSSADTPRFDHDPTTGESLGLLIEESRTNILLNSTTLSTQSVTTSATAYTLSFYGTGTVTLSGTSTAGPLVGTGANDRVTLTFTPTAGTLTLTVTGTVSNAQLEAGSFPTSYIPTTGTALTRSADVASITGSNFSSWYNQREGTIFAEAQMEFALSQSAFPSIYTTGSFPNRLWSLYLLNTINRLSVGADAHSVIFKVFSSSPQSFKVAQALSNSNLTYSVSVDGATPLTGSLSKSITNTISIAIGVGAGAVRRISRLTYFPERLPDSSLQTMTQ